MNYLQIDTVSLVGRTTHVFLESLSIEQLLAGFIMSLIGLFVSMLLDAATRQPLSTQTPVQWSWKCFWYEKLVRVLRGIALTVLVIFISLRFIDHLIGPFSMFYALMIGFCLDEVKDKWKWLRSQFNKKPA